jgi:hypothetical protein
LLTRDEPLFAQWWAEANAIAFQNDQVARRCDHQHCLLQEPVQYVEDLWGCGIVRHSQDNQRVIFVGRVKVNI